MPHAAMQQHPSRLSNGRLSRFGPVTFDNEKYQLAFQHATGCRIRRHRARQHGIGEWIERAASA